MADRRSTARDLAQIAVFAALIAALGLPGTLQIAGNAVPITLQTLGVMLTGSLIGARKGALAVLTFLVLVACGLPLLAGGRGGIAFLTTSPTAGYAWGFLLGVVVTGLLTHRILPAYPLWLGLLVNAVGGVLAVYLVGTLWLAVRTGLLGPAVVGNGIYLPGDALKVVVATLVVKQVHRAHPGLMGAVRRPGLPTRATPTLTTGGTSPRELTAGRDGASPDPTTSSSRVTDRSSADDMIARDQRRPR